MAIKVDLEKAYDRIDWQFLEDTLREIELPSKLISLIMACVTECKMQVLWNDEPSK